MMELLLDRYMKEVSHCLTLNRRQKKQLFAVVRPELEEELDGQKIDSFESLVKLLGAPAHMAEELASTESYQAHVASAHKGKRRLFAVIAALLLVAGGFMATTAYLWGHMPAYYTVSLEVE